MKNRVVLVTISVLFAASLNLGCGGTKEGFAIVSGTIKVDGSPAETGYVNFMPLAGAANPVGTKIINGEYSIEAPLGESKVEVRVPKVIGEKKLYQTPDSPVRKIFAESLPDKFNNQSILLVTVKPGSNEQDFELSTEE